MTPARLAEIRASVGKRRGPHVALICELLAALDAATAREKQLKISLGVNEQAAASAIGSEQRMRLEAESARDAALARAEAAEGKAAAWDEIDKRSDDAHAYGHAHLMPRAWGHNVWHAILDDAIRLRALTTETCICAAIRLDDGEIFRGHRHDDAILTAGKAGVERDRISSAEQGFITSRNRFVSREEGAHLQFLAGIPSAQTKKLPKGMLFSEDLYLRSTKGQPLPVPPATTDEEGA